jgi:hypothetical protein
VRLNQEIFIRLRQYAKDKVALTTSDILRDSVAINCNEEDKEYGCNDLLKNLI